MSVVRAVTRPSAVDGGRARPAGVRLKLDAAQREPHARHRRDGLDRGRTLRGRGRRAGRQQGCDRQGPAEPHPGDQDDAQGEGRAIAQVDDPEADPAPCRRRSFGSGNDRLAWRAREVEGPPEAARLDVPPESPVALDECGDGGGVQGRAVDEAPARVRAHEQCGHAKSRPVRRANVIEPPARLVVGPQEGRAVPGAAARERRDERPGERRTGRDPPGRMLAGAGRRDVRNRWQSPAFEVDVVLVEIHDATAISHGYPHRLPAALAEPRVVVLHVELPRDPAVAQPAEDPAHPEAVVRQAAVGRRGEEAVEEDVLLGDVPVERQVTPVVVAHDRTRD